jgi:Tol biopolymer transport system component/DNA-binding winged helix-turn-helix (wHTH) protein
MEPAARIRRTRFGAFAVDLRSGELYKHGIRLKLQEQPFQVLALLLEHPGEVITREELRERLWPAETFVDFDTGLNSAVKKLRDALGDSAEEPRYIETLPRRGYRFMAPVENGGSTASTAVHVERPEQPKSIELPASVNAQGYGIASGGWKIGMAAGSVIFILSLGLIFSFKNHRWGTHPSQPLPLEVVPLTALPGQEISPSFSPDGSQVAFGWDGENNGAGFDLYAKVIGTEKPLRLTNHPALWIGVAWSPDGRSIAVYRMVPGNGGIFLVPALGGPERKLASANDMWPPWAAISWSPDGKQLAFVAHRASTHVNSNQLFLLSLDTLEQKPVETGCGNTYDPAFSPNGDTLAYSCYQDDGHFSLNLKDLRTGRNTQLWSGVRWIHGVTWTHGGARIVFASSPGNSFHQGGDLWQISLGESATPEKIPAGHDATSLAFSASSHRLAYAQSQLNANIWRVDLDKAVAHTRILARSTREQYGPVISPDGSRVAFMSNRSGSNEIWVCDSDGGNSQQLTSFGDAQTGTPRWSPDGRLIVFDSRIGGEANVYVVDANGGVPKKLETGTRMNSLPSWSHDGRWIYFASGPTDSSLTIWRVAAAGGHATQLIKTRSSMALESPDGQYVYFVRTTADNVRLWRILPDGSNEKMLDAIPPLRSDGYEWWPSGTGIYFHADESGKPEINFVDLRTFRIHRIYSPEKPPAQWLGGLSVSRDGKWLVYSRIDEAASDLMLVENFD